MILPATILKRQKGFTLLEVIIALFIFTLGVLGVAAMQLRAIQGNSSGQRLTEATAQAQEMIERIMAEPYTNFIPPVVPVIPSTTSTVAGLYTVARTIAAMPGGSALTTGDALWVTITVAWTESGIFQGSTVAVPGVPGTFSRSVVASFIKSRNVETSYGPVL